MSDESGYNGLRDIHMVQLLSRCTQMALLAQLLKSCHGGPPTVTRWTTLRTVDHRIVPRLENFQNKLSTVNVGH